MAGATNVLMREGFAKWFRTRGLLMVIAVGLIPPALTAAWVGTHSADFAVTDISWDPEDLVAGDNVTIQATLRNLERSATDGFDVVIRVGHYEQSAAGALRWRDTHNETVHVDGLDGREERVVSTQWETQPGTFRVEAYADFFAGEIKEIEKLNNYRADQIQVAYQAVEPDVQAPPPGANETDDTLPDAELRVASLDWSPRQIYQDDNVTFTVTVANDGPEDVTNATLDLRLFQLSTAGAVTAIPLDRTETFDLSSGDETTFSFELTGIGRGLFAAAAFLDTSGASRTDSDEGNVVLQQFDVQRRLVWEDPEERATAKDFYRSQVLLPLHYTLLVPLIGLFFAGGALHDERSRGNLVYLLTRPVPRWSLPITRFASGFLVALIAVLVGIFVTFLVIMGTPQSEPSYLWWPLVFGVLVLFTYSAVFTFVGVVSDRPYLIGLLYVLGFETLVLAGRRVLVNGQPLVQDWVLNLSILSWVQKAFAGWDPSAGFHLLPQGDEAVRAFFVLLGIGVVALAGSVWAMRMRQFPE